MAFSFFMRRKDENEKSKNKIVITATDKNKKQIPVPSQPKDLAQNQVYAFIDASNLFWGGKESIGFGVNYKSLLAYLAKQYGVTKAFYYGGLRIFDFEYSILDHKPLDLAVLETYLKEKMEKEETENEKNLIQRSLNKVNFYRVLESYGYQMKIKPAKVYYDEDDENNEHPILKANCDVDMTFDMLRYMQQYIGIVAMTGDGDFAPVLNYLKYHDRKVTVISRWHRTAKEIKEIAEDNFLDIEKIRHSIELR
jgi:uncharacterized LabA/DUF88 family protein